MFMCIRSAIKGLLRWSSPSAVLGLIVTVIVDTVYRHTWIWFSSHIFKKSSEIISPSFTNSYTSSSVTFVAIIAKFITARAHMSPATIFCKMAPSARATVFQVIKFLKASAAFRISTFKITSSNHTFITAFADTVPAKASIIFSAWSLTEYGPTIEFLSNKTWKVPHKRIIPQAVS